MGCKESKHIVRPATWEPYSFFDPSAAWNDEGRPPFALLILNQQISNKQLFCCLWKNSHLQVCADGGANRLYDCFGDDERENHLPDRIIGDLDSLRDDVRAYYESRGVEVVRDPDQDSTDFGKCMNYITTHDPPASFITPPTVEASLTAVPQEVENPKMAVVAVGGIGGRVDQSFHSIHALYVAQQGSGMPRQVYLSSKKSITFLLRPGQNVISTPQASLGPCCGILPVGCPSMISTTGLEWNLTNAETKFGGKISTSNHTVADVVNIETTEPVVFTIEFRG